MKKSKVILQFSLIAGFFLLPILFKAQVSFSGCYISGALIDPGSTAGCGNSGTNNYCNLASLYVPAFTPTACGTFTSSSGVNHVKGTVYTLPAGCTATIEAEFKKRNYLGVGATATGCSNSGMDGSPDGLTITQSGGTIISQFSQIDVNVGTCGAYGALGSYTTAVATISPGCNNADGYVRMILTGGTFTVGGASNRADEIITFTINLSGTCGPSCSNVLPIELVSFYGVPDENKVNLQWKVASELNVAYYIIEKSFNGVDWMEISRIPSNSETFGINQTYQTWDYYPQAGINYYRLNNSDKNGDRGDSRVIMVNFARETMPFWLEQNKDELILHAGALSQNETVELYDVSGRLINSFVFSNGEAVLSKQNLAKGLYNLRSTFNQSFKFTKVIVY